MYESDIPQKLKNVEALMENVISPNHHFIIRLDGVAFHTFTKGIKKPFDDRLTFSMIETTKDLVLKFNAASGYHQSDEISLVFPAATEDSIDAVADASNSSKRQKILLPKSHIYAGRVQKLASVASSYASARLNYHLSKQEWDDLTPSVKEKMVGHYAYFDGRIVPSPDSKLIADCIFWRSNCDGLRNAISHISQAYYSQKQLSGKSLSMQVQMLKDEKNIDLFEAYSTRILFGTWVKKERYEVVGMLHPKTGDPLPNPVFRNRICTGSFNWDNWTEKERIDFIMEKYWKTDATSPPKDLI